MMSLRSGRPLKVGFGISVIDEDGGHTLSWAEISRSEAIRRLVEFRLKAKGKLR